MTTYTGEERRVSAPHERASWRREREEGQDSGRISLSPKSLAALIAALLTGLVGGGAGGPWLLGQHATRREASLTERMAVVETKVDLLSIQVAEVLRIQREQAGKGR